MIHNDFLSKSKNIFLVASLLFLPLFLAAQSGACPPSLTDVSALFGDPANSGTGISFANNACIGEAPGDPVAGLSATGSSINGGILTINGEAYTSTDVCDGNGNEVFGHAGVTPVAVTATYNVVVSTGGSTETCMYNSSGALILVPTLSEWGLIILGLLILTIGVVYANAPAVQLANGQTVRANFSIQNLPFEKNTFFKIWAIIAALIITGFGIATAYFGYEFTSADPYGSVVASVILAYLVMTLKMQEDTK